MKTKDLRDILSKNVCRFRAANHLSQDEFAARCGLHRTYVGSVERCERNVTLATLELIAKTMKVSPAELLTEKKS